MKKIINSALIVFSSGFIQTNILGIDSYAARDTLNVINRNGATLFDSPTAAARFIASVPLGGQLIVLESKCKKSITVNGMTGCFAKVQFGEKFGFVHDSSLSTLPAPRSTCGTFEDYLRENFMPVINEKDGADLLDCGSSKKKAPTSTTVYQKRFKLFKIPDVIPRVSVCEAYYDRLEMPKISLQEAYHIASQCVREYSTCPAIYEIEFPYTLDQQGNIRNKFCNCSFYAEKQRQGVSMSIQCTM